MIRSAAPLAPGALDKKAHRKTIRALVKPATSDAAVYLHTTASIGWIPRPIGLPAYHFEGAVKTQKDTHHATAIPQAPSESATRVKGPQQNSWKAARVSAGGKPLVTFNSASG
jgi:hypothetical protein